EDDETENYRRIFHAFDRDGSGAISIDELETVARIVGISLSLEELFELMEMLELQNNGSKLISEMSVVLTYNAMLYRLKKSIIAVPVLLPGLSYRADADSAMPALSAVVNMPVSEGLLSQYKLN
ncbi:MAG: hypothetical protein SGPRY_006535, partial [Prymnesium sp.]